MVKEKPINKKEQIPMVEIFETVEGEGLRAGFPTTFVRIFHCNLRCSWCDTTYSYAPEKPAFWSTIPEIVKQVETMPNPAICLTGGEPLIHGQKSADLLSALAKLPFVEDIHIETNGAIDITPFQRLREQEVDVQKKVRFILDYKLPGSGEMERMHNENLALLEDRDEIKFVIADRHDFDQAVQIVQQNLQKGTPLFSPVWNVLSAKQLVEWILEEPVRHVKLNLQTHKYIWDPDQRGV